MLDHRFKPLSKTNYPLKLSTIYKKTLNYFLPLDSNTSEVSLMVKGKSLGTDGIKPFSARAPCPISRLPIGPIFPVSLVAKGGNS